MEILDRNVFSIIAGGNPVFVAIGAGVSTYLGAASIINSTKTLNQFGHTLGEQIFNTAHPDQLGQMIYPVTLAVENLESK